MITNERLAEIENEIRAEHADDPEKADRIFGLVKDMVYAMNNSVFVTGVNRKYSGGENER